MSSLKSIDTEKFSEQLRKKAIDLDKKAILVTNFSNSQQEQDLTEPANCKGFGRKRHFKLDAGWDWPQNPLPIYPAAKALNMSTETEFTAQVFQNSICNWRCWYCFVDFELLSGNAKHASFLTCDELLDLYLAEEDRPMMLDLSGGQPDLTPEWVLWMMESLEKRSLDKKIYLWSDDNLSNDYLWRYLSEEQINKMLSYEMYSRVCCFKGIDENSFSLNTNADPKLFKNQFNLCKRLIDTGFDLYSYITLTAETSTDFSYLVPKFFDEIQTIHEMLPLRIIPLRVFEFTPSKSRMNKQFEDMLNGQMFAVKVWCDELEKRFSTNDRALQITEININ